MDKKVLRSLPLKQRPLFAVDELWQRLHPAAREECQESVSRLLLEIILQEQEEQVQDEENKDE